MRPTHLLLLTVLLTSCQTAPLTGPKAPSTTPVATPAPLLPGAVPTPTPAPSPEPSAADPAALTRLLGRVSLFGEPVSGATLILRLAKDGRALGEPVTTDADGRFVLPLSETLPPGTLTHVTVTGTSGKLHAMWAWPGSAPASVTVDVGSTLATKRMLPKLREVLSSEPGPAALTALQEAITDLAADLTRTLMQPATDQRLERALAKAKQEPTADNLDALADAASLYSPLHSPIVALVEQADRAIIAGIQAGGPVVMPAPWRFGPTTLAAPTVRRTGHDTLTITYKGTTTTVTTRPAAFEAGEPMAASVAALHKELENKPPVVSSGGGGGTGLSLLSGRLLLLSDRAGQRDAYVHDLGNNALTRFTNNMVANCNPVLSPDGTRFAYQTDVGMASRLQTINLDGTGLTTITNTPAPSRVSWRPDSGKLVFADLDGTNKAMVRTVNPDGTAEAAITARTYDPDGWLSWSPDGSKIAYISGDGTLDVMNPDGTGVVTVDIGANVLGGVHWLPDSSRIVFATFDAIDMEIVSCLPDGTDRRTLTANGDFDAQPAISPRGDKIVFASERDGGDREIYVMNSDGTGQTRLTTAAGADGHPRWSPDGTRIAFSSVRDGNPEIYVMWADGTGQTRVTIAGGDDEVHAWF